jgi:tRNA U55 pseudouridine synthase TruB
MIIEVYKPIGTTCVELINNFKNNNTEIKKLCFAGRLDPLAHGKLYILTNDDVYKKEIVCNYDKIYETYVINGIVTDTYDIMGIPRLTDKISNIKNNIKIGERFKQKYPPYSSVIVKKYHKPYWYVAKNKLEISDDDIPTNDIEIKKLEILEEFDTDKEKLFELITSKIALINTKYDFRQNEIINCWKSLLEKHNDNIHITKIKVLCTSGTYIRNIANVMNGCCYDIHRTSYVNE